MLLGDPLVLLVLAAGFYMAWNIGANDLANSMGDIVGSRALTLKQVIILAGTLNVLGATFWGWKVTKTVGKGIVPIGQIESELLVIGALSILLGAGILITLATWLKLPVSTTHSIVGAVLGFGLVNVIIKSIAFSQIKWIILLKVVLSWILSPLAGALLAFIIYRILRKVLLDRTLNIEKLEGIFRYFVIASSGYQSFSHGSNDVANAIAPLMMIFGLGEGSYVPRWILFFGGMGIAIGLATWGYRVVWTIGKRITELTPTRGFSADMAAASTVFFCSALGMPVSTTHTLVGAVIGIGLARGLSLVNLRTIRDIFISWILTVPIAALISALIFWLCLIIVRR
jgi:PiT family inorganic phosphate transporter